MIFLTFLLFPHFSLDKRATVLYTVVCYGRLAQLVELPLDVRKVTGSSPVPSTIKTHRRRPVRFLFL